MITTSKSRNPRTVVDTMITNAWFLSVTDGVGVVGERSVDTLSLLSSCDCEGGVSAEAVVMDASKGTNYQLLPSYEAQVS